MSVFEVPPLRPLPASLPAGERLLWQGGPQWRAMALRVFHVRKVAIYFALLIGYRVVAGVHDATPFRDTIRPALVLAGLGLAACLILAALAWLVSRTTTYSITSGRVIMQIGVALPITFNLPFGVLSAAAVKLNRDGTGTVPLTLTKGNRLSYAVLWPHVRPWRNAKAEPSLRLIPDAARVARLLAEAVTAALPDRVAAPPVVTAAAETMSTRPFAPTPVTP